MLPADEVIIKDKGILSGTPVFRGTRVPFQALLDYLEGGQNLEEFPRRFSHRNPRGCCGGSGASEVDARQPAWMKILIDECIPRKFKRNLPGTTA
jgi:hypothetical protein